MGETEERVMQKGKKELGEQFLQRTPEETMNLHGGNRLSHETESEISDRGEQP